MIKPGMIVMYKLSVSDIEDIKHRRRSLEMTMPRAGDLVPMIVVRVWPDNIINGQAMLDAPMGLHETSVSPGDGLGEWGWLELPSKLLMIKDYAIPMDKVIASLPELSKLIEGIKQEGSPC